MASKNQQLSSSLSLFLILLLLSSVSSSNISDQIQRGFTATPDSSLQFQSILTDPTSTFSFGFLRINSTGLDLAILHLPSSFPLWRAIPSRPASWSSSTTLSFNGALLLSDPDTGIFWSTNTSNGIGDTLVLLDSSNLQIRKNDKPISKTLWQSFDFPLDTIMQDQNLTSKAPLFSSNQRFSMSLGDTYLALYIMDGARPMYWKHTAWQAKASIVEGEGPIYARINSTGFLGVYQKDNAPPVDVLSFDTFNSGLKKSHRRLTLESDGNFRAYYWSGSAWVSDYVAISKTCDLPAACGSYGMCHVEGQQCGGCVDNRTEGCFPAYSGDLCAKRGNRFGVVRRAGVDLVNKELLAFTIVRSLEECEGLCEKNCSCWGAAYNNASGHCYPMNYPIQTLLAVSDQRLIGYFKVRDAEEGGDKGRTEAGIVLIVAGVLVLVCGGVFAGYRIWSVRKLRRSGEDDEVGMPYKDLNSTSSFRSIEMSNSFRK